MTYVITSPCIDVKDGACQKVCPVEAIFEDDAVPAHEAGFTAINADFFGPSVTGWGTPGGVAPEFVTTKDHPLVTQAPQRV